MSESTHLLQRRGYELGHLHLDVTGDDSLNNWQAGKPVVLRGYCVAELACLTQELVQTETLLAAILDEVECETLFDQAPYVSRLAKSFASIGCSINQGDEQEIETLNYDVVHNSKTIAHDLWLKISWLSFHEQDASLRFRFSFGEDLVEDVAADTLRQNYASELCNAIFPESKLVTENSALNELLCTMLSVEAIKFVERIVYFNAPQGGAYFHHDRERGHAGVVFAQLSGQTCWFALSKQRLMDEIISFVAVCFKQGWPAAIDLSDQELLTNLGHQPSALSDELETFSNTALINLINQCPEFISQLHDNGHGRLLNPGDLILLPQEGEMDCCWHSVFCIGDEIGQALSFAIREN